MYNEYLLKFIYRQQAIFINFLRAQNIKFYVSEMYM